MPEDLSNPPPQDPRGEHRDRSGELARLRRFLAERSSEAAGFVLSNVAVDRYDARLFREVLDAEPELRRLVNRAGRDAPKTFGPLLLDLFASFYKMVPGLVGEASVDPAHMRANRPFIVRLREDEGTLISRLSTATDEVASALATIEAARRILEELARRPALRDWMDEEAGRPEHPQTEDRPTPGAPAEDPPGPHPDGGPEAGERNETPSESSDDPARDLPDGFAADMRAVVREAAGAASAEAEAHAQTLRDWGLAPADLRTLPIGERLELARNLRTRRMRDLADLLGKMRNHRRAAERRKVKASRDEVYDVETSGDIGRVLPPERARAFGSKNAGVRRDFFRRLSQRAVQSYALRTEDPVGRGPVIAMIDASGSMVGSPMEWASAVALALAHAATGGAGTGARRVHAIFFNAQIVLETELAPGERDVRKFLQMGTVAAVGGTEYLPPLSRALEIVSAGTKAGEGNPDLLLVTDGICKLPADFASRLGAEKISRGFKLVSVLVGDHARAGSVEPFSDKVIRARDLARASGARDAAGELFENL